MKKKILLLNPPADTKVIRDKFCCSTSKADYYWQPIDLLVLSGILFEKYEIAVIDAIVENLNRDETASKIFEFSPEFIILLTGTSTWIKDFLFIKKIKEHLTVYVAAIGGNLLELGKEILEKYNEIDAVLLDFTTPEIINLIERDSCIQYKSIIVRGQNNQTSAENKNTGKYFEYPPPRHELFPLKKYTFPLAKKNPFTVVITDYGCPHKCKFCVCEMISYKKRNLTNVLDEFDYIKNLGIKEIFINDFSFGVDKNHSLELCKKMIERNYNFSWSCQARVDIDKELLSTMKRAGCHTIQFGVESGSQRILDLYSKNIKKEKTLEIFKFCKEIDIRTSGYFIFGLIGETEEDLKATLEFALELNPDFAAFSVAMPREGTSLSKKAQEKGLLKDELIETDTNVYPIFETPELSSSLVWKYRKKAIRKFYFRPSYIIKQFFKIRTLTEFKANLSNAAALFKNAFKK